MPELTTKDLGLSDGITLYAVAEYKGGEFNGIISDWHESWEDAWDAFKDLYRYDGYEPEDLRVVEAEFGAPTRINSVTEG